jgi:hypothetical protein
LRRTKSQRRVAFAVSQHNDSARNSAIPSTANPPAAPGRAGSVADVSHCTRDNTGWLFEVGLKRKAQAVGEPGVIETEGRGRSVICLPVARYILGYTVHTRLDRCISDSWRPGGPVPRLAVDMCVARGPRHAAYVPASFAASRRLKINTSRVP